MKTTALLSALLLSVFLAGFGSAQDPETAIPDWKKEFTPEDDSWKRVKR